MPYNIAESAGGDSAANVAAVEACVKELTAKGYEKERAIAICKSSRQKKMRKRRAS